MRCVAVTLLVLAADLRPVIREERLANRSTATCSARHTGPTGKATNEGRANTKAQPLGGNGKPSERNRRRVASDSTDTLKTTYSTLLSYRFTAAGAARARAG